MSFIVAIDGPAGAGKGTITKLVGERMKLSNIDTGATYRCVTLAMIKQGIKLEEKEKILSLLNKIDIEFQTKDGIDYVYLNGEDVSKEIRSKDVNELVSQVSHIPEVRKNMADFQRKLAEGRNVIMEGRDIGTNVFPNANLKIYLDATPEERANRRLKQNEEQGINIPYEEILENIKFRDHNDLTSTVAPLKRAEDAVYIDSTNMTIPEVVDKIVEEVERAKVESLYEVGLPKYLQHDIDQFKKGLETEDHLLDCYFDELYGSINSAYYSNEISKKQADYLRFKYLFNREDKEI